MGCIDMLRLTPCPTGLRYGAAMPTPDLNLLFTLDVLLQEGLSLIHISEPTRPY